MIDPEVQEAYDAQHPELQEGADPIESSSEGTEKPIIDPSAIEHTPTVDVSPTIQVDREDLPTPDQNADWYLSEGVAGQGEKPEWFNDKTFKTLADQAKAQPELRKKLASFTGAPNEGYEISLSEDLGDIQMDEEDPLLNQFADMATEMNMSQEGFNQLLNFYVQENVKFMEEEAVEHEKHWKEEYEKLGPNAEEDLKLLKQWAQHNIPDELQKGFYDMLTTAESVQIFNMLMDKIIPSQITHVSAGTGLSRHNLQELMKDSKYGRDPDFTRHVDSEAQHLYAIKKNPLYG